jgi:cobalt-zinc-cadmium efflux system protein
MAHDYHHAGHSHGPARYDRAFAIGIALNLVYVAFEATFGVLSGSLALIADAGHNLFDVLGLALAWGAAWLSRKASSPRRTYGFRRSSILASLGNAMLLLVAVGAISLEAARHLFEPQAVETGTVLWVAALGVLINAGTAMLFASGRKGDINVRGAYLHMMADAGVTLGVIAAALLIGRTGWLWLDPATSLLIAVVILLGTWGLLRDAVDLSLDAVPGGIDRARSRRTSPASPGWPRSTTCTSGR